MEKRPLASLASAASLAIALVVLAALLVAVPAGFSACPVGTYPDSDDSDCKEGVPYSVSVAHRNLGSGRMQFDITITNIAQRSVIGITSSSEHVVPAFYYSDGSKVQLGDYSRETTTASIAKGGCGIYPVYPGESVTFSTVSVFKPGQDGKALTASADIINWMVLPAYPTCSPIGAQGRENRAGTDKFVFRYENAGSSEASCSAEGTSCVGKVCCEGLYCNSAGACAKITSGSPSAGDSGDGPGSPAGSRSGNPAWNGTGSLISNPVVLGMLLGVVVLGAVAYFVFIRGKNGEESGRQRHKK
ncbi:MAG: hypothetical protein V1820_02695 [archaeon]